MAVQQGQGNAMAAQVVQGNAMAAQVVQGNAMAAQVVQANPTDDIARNTWFSIDGRRPTTRVIMSEVFENGGEFTYDALRAAVGTLHQKYVGRPMSPCTWNSCWHTARQKEEVELCRHKPGKYQGDLIPLYRWKGMPVRNYGPIISTAVEVLNYPGGCSADDVHHFLVTNFTPAENPPLPQVVLSYMNAMTGVGTLLKVSRDWDTPRFRNL